MSRKILIVLSEYGYWGEELIAPLELFEDSGYSITFATPTGKRPVPVPQSLDPSYVDPPLGRVITTAEMAAKVKAFSESPIVDNPLSLAELIPVRPYVGTTGYLQLFEDYNEELKAAIDPLVEAHDMILVVGGAGPFVDIANNERLHAVILGFYRSGKPIGAECYGVTSLAFARDLDTRKSIIEGKHVTGHPKDYDYLTGTGILGTDINMSAPYPLEYILRDATGPDGGFHGGVGNKLSAIVDYPFITGRTTSDSQLTGELAVAVLEKGLRRYGW